MSKRPPIEQQITFLHAQDLAETAVFYEQILGLKRVLDQGSCHIYAMAIWWKFKPFWTRRGRSEQ
jgi:catechol-2,3-dioxygenase